MRLKCERYRRFYDGGCPYASLPPLPSEMWLKLIENCEFYEELD